MLIKRLTLKKILSFNDATVDLAQLNVLIGPNGVGKSNLLEIISLLQAAPTPNGLIGTILRGGGVRQWLWLGDGSSPPTSRIAAIECELSLRRGRRVGPLEYQLQFSEDASGFVIVGEELSGPVSRPDRKAVTFFTRTSTGERIARKPSGLSGTEVPTKLLSPTESLLAQHRTPGDPTPITEVGNHLGEIQIFREFRTGFGSGARSGSSTSVANESLDDAGANLALVLQHLDFHGLHDRIRKHLHRFCERFEDVKVDIRQGLAQLFLQEAGLAEKLSSQRMSDGTLKFLALLAVLFQPKPPPLVCLEEPELGLHPDAVLMVADILIEASESMQLIVTTHSEALVDALTDRPETVLVCDRDFDHGTKITRLEKKRLRAWLEHYSLGELWRKGEIGGGRW